MTRSIASREGAAALLLIGCLVLGGCAGHEASVPALSPPSAAAPATPTATPTPSATQAVEPAVDVVPSAAPTHLSFPAASIDGEVAEYTAAQAEADGGINPPGLQAISWYSGIPGGIPGSAAANTVYLFGHTWVEPAVFNGLVDVKPGDEATLVTPNGELTYRVDETFSLSKSDFNSDPRVTAKVPGRLVLVSCWRPPGWDPTAHAPDNIVVFLSLVEAHAA